ncbi:MAG: helix-turn-helix domain-containing protein [Christensenellales bacterium]
MNELKEIIAKNLITYRTKAKLSQLELAQKINYSDKSISKWERGLGVPDCFVLKQLADLYNIKVDDFFVENENSKNIQVDFSKSKQKKHILITLLSCGLVWLVATFVFVGLCWVKISGAWLSFIVAIPVTAIVLIVFSSLWWQYFWVGIFSSVLSWTLAMTFHLMFPSSRTYLLYILCVPLQILIVMWVILHYLRNKKTNNQTDNQINN